MAIEVTSTHDRASISREDIDPSQPSLPGETRTVLLRVEHELDSASAFELADLTAVEVDALSKRLHAHKDLLKARFRLARAAKIRPHRMQIACALLGRTVVLALLAPDDKDPQVIVEQLLPLARIIEDEWFARDQRARSQASPNPETSPVEHGESSNPPEALAQHSSGAVAEQPCGPQATFEHPDRIAPPAKQAAGHVTVTYSAGGEAPRHPPLTLPPPPPRAAANLRLGEAREIACEIYRRTAADRCMLKEVEGTRLKEATFSTSRDLPTLINMLAGFPAVLITVQDYLSDQADVPPPFHYHIVGLAALTDGWDQEVSMVAHLQACVDKMAALLKKLKTDKLKARKIR